VLVPESTICFLFRVHDASRWHPLPCISSTWRFEMHQNLFYYSYLVKLTSVTTHLFIIWWTKHKNLYLASLDPGCHPQIIQFSRIGHTNAMWHLVRCRATPRLFCLHNHYLCVMYINLSTIHRSFIQNLHRDYNGLCFTSLDSIPPHLPLPASYITYNHLLRASGAQKFTWPHDSYPTTLPIPSTYISCIPFAHKTK
jgi:hypothetical protein